MATKEENKIQAGLIAETHDAVIELKTVLLGANGDDGLCGEVRHSTKRLNILERNFWLFAGVVVGTGVLGGGIWGVLQAIN